MSTAATPNATQNVTKNADPAAAPAVGEWVKPFPALTPEQRFHFDLYGYVIVPDVLSHAECDELLAALRKLRGDLRAIPDPAQRVIRQAYFATDQPHHTYMGAIGQYGGPITGYCINPKIVAMAEEVIGGKCHILEANAHLNTKAPEWPKRPDGSPQFGFHRGLPVSEGVHYRNGLYHSSFVKVLTNLTDLGPDDGGTVVIPGTHKIDVEDGHMIEAAYADPKRLIHQVIAPRGSSLLFTEGLIHATGRITSDRERGIMICGYGTTWFPWKFMDSHRPDFAHEDAFMASLPEPVRYLYQSKGYIQRQHRYRTLGEPVAQ